MSDEEDQVVGSEEEELSSEEESSEEEDEESDEEQGGPADSGPSEAQLAMQRRRQQQSSLGANLDEAAQEILEQSRVEREKLEDEIQEMRARNERRKKEREEEDKRLAERRAEEEAQRKAVEEERRRKKEEEEMKRKEMRAARLAAYEALSLPQGRNFVITKKEGGDDEGEDDEELERKEKKSKEQQEQERKAILSQRIKPMNMEELNSSAKLAEKAKELHSQIVRLESEKYDLEKRFKAQQYDMMELAERARQMNKVGKGGLKRVALKEDEVDKFQERFAGAPAKVEMYSRYERQKDKRNYSDRHEVFHGPTWKYPAQRISPKKIVKWDEDTGLPIYENMDGVPEGGEEMMEAQEE